MLISCPNCAATYEVPDHLLTAGGQALECARCAHEWIVVPAQPSVPVLEANEVAASARVVAAPRFSPRMQVGAVIAAWVISLVVVGSLGWGVVHWRGSVMAAWPPSQRAYQAVGLN